MIKVEIRP